MNQRRVKTEIYRQGSVEFISDGYCLVGNDEVVAFFIDPRDRCSVEGFSNTLDGIPTILCCSGEESEDLEWTEIGFPEYRNLDIHSVKCGKTVSVCLVDLKKMA